jgi:hypothetical protein
VSPRIETDPGTETREAWIYLTPAEAIELAQALIFWADEDEPRDPEWHAHIRDSDGREVTIAIEESQS